VRILLDTQCWIWMTSSPARLSPVSRDMVASIDNDLMLSAASSWEIVIKHALGKLRLPEPPDRFIPSRLQAFRTGALSIEHQHVLRVGALPSHHRDPFDRLLVAQAQVERMPIVTADPIFKKYDVEIIDA
jgi:PIN domain nuclease of toxin-antitoxin system